MKLKEKYAYHQLRKKIETSGRSIKLPRLDKLSKVGVLWQPQQKDAYNYLHDYFSHSQVIFRKLCICDNQVPPIANSNSITRKDCNWVGLPVSATVDNFIKTEFDVLFNVSLEQNLVLDYITALSRAKFKIGWSENESNYFDLNINISGKQEALYLAEQQIFYLGELNKTKTDGRTF